MPPPLYFLVWWININNCSTLIHHRVCESQTSIWPHGPLQVHNNRGWFSGNLYPLPPPLYFLVLWINIHNRSTLMKYTDVCTGIFFCSESPLLWSVTSWSSPPFKSAQSQTPMIKSPAIWLNNLRTGRFCVFIHPHFDQWVVGPSSF